MGPCPISISITIELQIPPEEELRMKNCPDAQLEHTLYCQIGSSNWLVEQLPESQRREETTIKTTEERPAKYLTT